MHSNTTVLVTGGAGFIGCALSQRLARSFDRWVAVDSLHPQIHPDRIRPAGLADRAELIIADISETATWDTVLADIHPDIVIHLAAETGTAQSLDDASRHAEVNVLGTTRMLDGFTRQDIVPERILLSSSRAVYGEGRWKDRDSGAIRYPGQRGHSQLAAAAWDFPGLVAVPATAAENTPAPTSVYGATKLAQEQIVSAWVGARDSELCALRLQNVYGPGQSLINSYTGIVSLFSQLARAGKSIPVYEDGGIVRDFVFIDDVVTAFAAALGLPGCPGVRVFDVGSGTATTVQELAEVIATHHGAPAPHVTGAFRDGDVRFAACDIVDTTNELGWTPAWPLAQGVAALQDWIDAQLGRSQGVLVSGATS